MGREPPAVSGSARLPGRGRGDLFRPRRRHPPPDRAARRAARAGRRQADRALGLVGIGQILAAAGRRHSAAETRRPQLDRRRRRCGPASTRSTSWRARWRRPPARRSTGRKLRDDLIGPDPARALDGLRQRPARQGRRRRRADPDPDRPGGGAVRRRRSGRGPALPGNSEPGALRKPAVHGGHGAEVGLPRAASIGDGADGAVRGILARTDAARPRAPDHRGAGAGRRPRRRRRVRAAGRPRRRDGGRAAAAGLRAARASGPVVEQIAHAGAATRRSETRRRGSPRSKTRCAKPPTRCWPRRSRPTTS